MLRVILYPHPTLRHASKPLKRVDAELRQVVVEMFQLMYEHRGVGLAANQVDLPYRLFVANPTGDPNQPEHEAVFINPVITDRKGSEEAEEGCLSLPGLAGLVRRPDQVTVNAYNLAGEEFTVPLSGLPARIAQHEIDHLDGVLFIDRLTPTGRLALKEELDEFEVQFVGQRERGELPTDEQIAARILELENART